MSLRGRTRPLWAQNVVRGRSQTGAQRKGRDEVLSAKPEQKDFFSPQGRQYGGTLLRTRKGRAQGRPLATRRSMHLVLRSSVATGDWSMNRPMNRRRIADLVDKFASRHHIRVHSFANVGNHLHLHIQLSKIAHYRPFIRGLTSAIAMAITGISRWSARMSEARVRLGNRKFWDYRPFTRIITGRRDFLGVEDYLSINRFESLGVPRNFGVQVVQRVRVWQKLIDEIKVKRALRMG